MTQRRGTTWILILFTLLMISGGCGDAPTTLVVNVTYDDSGGTIPAGPHYLYLRLIPQNGTGVASWSNEASPYLITDLAHGNLYRYLLTPDDTVLTDTADLYMFDAYFYDADLSPASIDPTNGGDVQRFTGEAIVGGGATFYDPAPHLGINIQILPGTQKHIILTTLQE